MAISPISSYNSTTRIVGLASGMDTDTIIQNAMKAEQAKMDRLYKNNTKLEWKRDAYQDINSQLQEFRNKFMSALSADNVFSASTYKAFKTNLSSNSYVNVVANTNAYASQHIISKVTLAESATISGGKYRNRVTTAGGTSNIFSRMEAKGAAKINAAQAAADPSTITLGDLEKEDGSKVFGFDPATPDQELSFTINNQKFSFKQNQTLQDMYNEINASGVANATIAINSDGQFLIQSKVVGSKSDLKLANLNDDLKMFGDAGIGVTTVKRDSAVDISTTTLAEIEALTGNRFGFNSATNEAKFSINGVEFTVSNDMAVQDVMDMVNGATGAKAELTFENGAFVLKSVASGTNTGLKLENVDGSNIFGEYGLFGIEEGALTQMPSITRDGDTIATAAEKMGVALQLDGSGNFNFKVNDVEFSFNAATTSLQKMIDTVNGNSEANVTLSYSQITDSFVFTSKETGAEAKVSVANVDGGSNAFGDEKTSFFGVGASTETGKDATLVIDGETITRSTNTFELDGLQITLKMDFDATSEVDKQINFSVEQDVDSAVDKVKNFVKEYNTLVKALNDLVNEEIDYDYEPLTEEQLDALSDKEIEKWEAEAKKGILRNDSTIRSFLAEMRASLYDKVGDTGLSPADIGLTTGKWSDYGQISFDEDVFKEALIANPDKVAQVMAGTSSAAKGTDQYYQESGIITRFFNQMTSYETTVKDSNLTNTNKAIDDNKEAMETLLERMYELEERYYQQFALMETLMTQYQSQSDWLTQQLSSLG